MSVQPRHVLIVDDDELARLEAARCVENTGHRVSQAANGGQAIEMLRSERFDLMLLDLLMPDMDGYEVLRQLRSDATLPEIPVIVVTAVGDAASASKCLELGAASHLTKPLDHARLTGMIHSVIGPAG